MSEEELALHYASTRLGNLISGGNGGFTPLFGGSPSEWPDWYLQSVLAFDRAYWQAYAVADTKRRKDWEAESTRPKGKPIELDPVKKEKALSEAETYLRLLQEASNK